MKALKIIGIIVGILVVLALVFNFILVPYVLLPQTKKASPEDRVELVQGDLSINVFYCQPGVKGRKVFGELVPYGQVWRTGANEASTFETNKDILVGGQTLPAGKYTLWTIPDESEWKVIFNDKMYQWGISWGGEALREPDHDKLTVTVPAETTAELVERFTITLDENPMQMTMSWENTAVAVPLQK